MAAGRRTAGSRTPDAAPAGRVVVGIDPGLASCGVGVVRERGRTYEALHWDCLRTKPTERFADRLATIHRACASLVRRHRPVALAMERLFFTKNQKTAFVVGQAQGAILLSLAGTTIEPFQYTPIEVKQAVTGDGRADKRAVAVMTARILGMAEIPETDDAADALAVAYCHLVSTRSGPGPAFRRA